MTEECAEGHKEQLTSYSHSMDAAIKFMVWLRLCSGSSSADITKSHDGVFRYLCSYLRFLLGVV